MSIEVKVPKVDEVQELAAVTKIHKKQGERVSKDEIIAIIETMKVSFEVQSPVNGVVEEVLAQEGAELPVGAPIYRIAPSG